jgi:hypothetical protein
MAFGAASGRINNPIRQLSNPTLLAKGNVFRAKGKGGNIVLQYYQCPIPEGGVVNDFPD